jgi:L-amino acid N-acyltransferase YncA
MHSRPAVRADAEAICRIYNQGIGERVATFETRLRAAEEICGWFDGVYPIVVVEEGSVVIAFASASSYRPRACYAGIAEFSVYVDAQQRGKGAGRMAMQALMDAAEAAGFWKLVSRVFVENTASRALLRSIGFREVGIYEKHGRLEGAWRDVVIVERLLPANLEDGNAGKNP